MAKALFHRGIRFTVSKERAETREWVIFPPDGPPNGAVRGMARTSASMGCYIAATLAAQAAIEDWLGTLPVAPGEKLSAGGVEPAIARKASR